MGFFCQARERLGCGTLALGLDGISWSLGHPTRWARPEVGQHDAQPEQDQDHQLIVDEVWYHRIAPLSSGVKGPFYRILELFELSAAVGYTTQRRQLVELLIDRVIVNDTQVEIRSVVPTGPNGETTPFCHLRLDYLDLETRGVEVYQFMTIQIRISRS
jgi:hypothetical protein